MTTLNDIYPTNDVDDVLQDWVRELIASTFRSEYKNSENLSATRVLVDADTPIQRFNCNGANRISQMPTPDAVNNHPFLVINSTSSGSYTLTLQNNAGTVTLIALNPSEFAFLLPDGNGGYFVINNPFSRVLSPSQVTANQNDWYPSGAGAVDVIRIDTDASRNFTGFGFAAAYKTILVVNAGSNPAVFKNEDASSTAANRFAFGADLTLASKQAVMMWYDPTSLRWRLVGGAGGSSGTVENLLLNSNFGQWTRRATPTSAVSMTNDAYNAPDCWYSLVQGAGATIARDTGIGNAQYAAKIVAGGTTNRYGIAQIRRSDVSIPLRGQSVTFQILLKPVNNAGSGTRDYRMAVLEWTGTADAVTSELVANWASATYTTAGFFASTTKTLVGTAAVTATHNTETALTVTGTVSSSCNNIIVFWWVEDVPTHASDYVLLSKPGLYQASAAQTWTPDLQEKAKTSEEIFLLTHSGVGRAESATMADVITQFPFMRGTPAASIQGTIKYRDLTGAATRTATTPSVNAFTAAQGGGYLEVNAASWSPANFTTGNMVALMCDAGNGILLTAEL